MSICHWKLGALRYMLGSQFFKLVYERNNCSTVLILVYGLIFRSYNIKRLSILRLLYGTSITPIANSDARLSNELYDAILILI